MEIKFVYKLHRLFQMWKKSKDPINRFYIMDEIDSLIQAELVKCQKS